MTTFGAGFITATGSFFVAVDRLHPVAVLVAHSGQILDVVSWAHRVEPPAHASWPNRRVAPVEDGLIIQDLPEGPIVMVRERSRQARIDIRHAEWPPDAAVRYRRLWGAGTRRSDTPGPDWRFRSVLEDRVFWKASVEVGSERHRLQFTSPATLLDHCDAGAEAAACVLRSNKRPWPFDAAVEIHVLSHGVSDVSDTVVDAISVDDLTWHPPQNPLKWRAELAEYLRYSLSQYHAALEHGGENVELTVHGAGIATSIELTFTLPELGDARVTRVDRPFDEIGNLAGLRSMNVLLGEDLAAGVPARLWTPDSRAVRI